jgi:Xaa-Pro aminopeptidase
MVISNEPGYYKVGAYGIRVENLVAVQPASTDGWLEFETLTYFPIERSLIEQHMLTRDQVEWLNTYHALVLERIGPLLEGEELAWLEEECAKI